MRKWRDASTVMVAARQTLAGDFRVLTARRHVESSFMPSSHVFPGGGLDPEDSGPQWERLHRAMELPHLRDLAATNGRLEVYRTPPGEHLPRFLSLRIAAVRETFEECGLLLCRRPGEALGPFGAFLEPPDGPELQKRLRDRDDPLNFHEVCRRLQCFPDVWSLLEGRNWLTPAHLPKRFDTAFFLVALDRTPPTRADRTEVSEVKWSSPLELLRLHGEGALWLPPPQLFELSKMAPFRDIRDLMRAAARGRFRSAHCFLPVMVALSDGLVFLLPDDGCYAQAGLEPARFQAESVATFRGLARRLSRLEVPGAGAAVLVESEPAKM